MITQPPTTPETVPWAGADDFPVTSIEQPDYWLNQTGSARVLREYWLRIPQEIRDVLGVWHRAGAWAQGSTMLVKWHIVLWFENRAYDTFGLGQGRSGTPWGGLYGGSPPPNRFHACAIVPSGVGAGRVLVHEYGHHIDFSFHRLWPTGDGSESYRLSDRAPFSTMWQAVRTSIPSALYGATNQIEWFAELWAAQIANQPTLFLQLAGLSSANAVTIRQMFTDRLPMPPMTGY